MPGPSIERVVGVDFSGARLAGRTAWLADCSSDNGRLHVRTLKRLGEHAGDDRREVALAWLVDAIKRSENTLWTIDLPFGLPFDHFGDWPEQLDQVAAFDGDAHAWGVDRLRHAGGRHLRRLTDVEEKAPFDSYHYRIAYQTFHGMRDVLRPLASHAGTAIVPQQPAKLPRARRVVVEACPSSTLKRLGLPHQNYKQPGGKPVDAKRRATRRVIWRAVRGAVEVSEHLRRKLMHDPGGDALDAVLCAVGGCHAWRTLDLPAVLRHERYPREGMIFA